VSDYFGFRVRLHRNAHSGRAHSKLAITRAIIQRSLARTIVLGATLATDLLANP
jgi:hypothetical protein